MEELVKVTELQHTLTGPELQKLRDENLVLTTENNKLKIEKLELDGAGAKKDVQSLTTLLDETKQRNRILQDELTAQLTNQKELQSDLNQLRSAKKSHDSEAANHKLKQEVSDLKKVKELLERQLKELADSSKSMRSQLTS